MIKLDTKPLSTCHVLIVDDDPVSQTILSTVLDGSVTCHVVSSGEQALAYCQNSQPDLILLNLDMPGDDGTTVCERLKKQTKTEAIPVIFVTSTIDAAIEDQCWEVGAADFIPKPITASTLIHRVKMHLQSKLRIEQLESMTLYDQLTGVYNRLYLKYEAPRLIAQLNRDDRTMSMVLVDIDFFKSYNDSYGHLEGDQCLQRVAQCLKDCLHRPGDAIMRFGGEEFLILLPYTGLSGAMQMAENMVEAVRNLNILHEHGVAQTVTISAGIAECDHAALKTEGINRALLEADEQLYAAKAQGKNRYSACQSAPN